jgi:hypothetical protein
VREERNLVHRFELVRRARENRRRVPLVSHEHSRHLHGGGEPLDDIGGVDLPVLSVVPANVERRQPLLGRPHVIGHDRNRIVVWGCHSGAPCTRRKRATPQPNLVPFMPRRSRKTHSNAMSGDASTLWDLPLTFNVIMIDLPAHPENWSSPNRRLERANIVHGGATLGCH